MSSAQSTQASAASLAFLGLLAGGVAVGFSPIFARLSDLQPLASGFYRLAFAVPAIWLILRFTGEKVQSLGAIAPRDRWNLVIAGIAFAADIACWHLAIAQTTIAEATLFANTVPVIVTLVSVVFLRERLRPLFVIGLAIALSGVATLALQKMEGAAATASSRLLGNILAFGAAAFYAVFVLVVSGIRRRCSTGTVMLYSSAVSALALLPFAIAVSPTMISGSLYGWSILVGLGLVSHAGGQGLFTYALAHLPASFSSMMGLMQVGVASIAAWILFSEPLTAMMLLSGAAILIGIALCRKATSHA
jgi:drug/metabolite transporter (DMT)-like permease